MDKVEEVEILYTVVGHRDPHSVKVKNDIKVAEFVSLVSKNHGITEAVEVLIEDEDDALGDELVLVEVIGERTVHVGHKHSKINVIVEYQNRNIHREYRPSATIRKILIWAVGTEGFNLEGKPSQYQLKHNGEVVPDDKHIGQVAQGAKEVTLVLVFRVKPQG